MDHELWTRVKQVAADAWECPPSNRSAFVSQACGGDEALSREVLSLLEAMADVGGRFETPALALTDAHVTAIEAIDAYGPAWIGERIGPWTLVRELGHGGMGTVFLADRTDAEFTQRAALKIMRGGAGDERLVTRFREERRILAALEHPNIARLIDGGATPLGLPYVVIEYVDGLPIDVFCERRGLDVRERIALFRRVCEAADYAHQRLIVHRDIKATNILVTADGVPKLLDFGIAKILDAERAADTTVFRMITPESASPEQIRGEPITTAADVYALGVLLYRLLTKQGPYRLTSGSDTELIQVVCEQIPNAPSTIAPAIDADLDRIVLKALRKEPERRYGSVQQFSEDLQRYLEGRPVLAAPDSRSYRVRKFVARHRLGVAVAAALAIAIAVGSTATAWQARVAQRERARAERQFQAVRTLATSVLGELHDSVSKLPGSTATRELLLRRTTEYLDALSREVGPNVDLRRELADGYLRLGGIQGEGGQSNVGNVEATVTSYRKALELLEPLAVNPGQPGDRLRLARTYVRVAFHQKDASVRQSYNQRALALLDALPAAERTSSQARVTAVTIWFYVGEERLDAKDYQGAKAPYQKMAEEAEAELKARPGEYAERNLSLAFKKLATCAELLMQLDEALTYYTRALLVDRARVERSPGSNDSRLDLSYSYGELGSTLDRKGDFDGARQHYRRALELRRAVVESDPHDDRAIASVANAYERLARVEDHAGNVRVSLDLQEARLAVLRDRAAAHPERDQPWMDYARALLDAATRSAASIESHVKPADSRKRLAARVEAMLDELERLHTRWTREHHTSTLPSSDADLQQARDRTRHLLTALAP
jgi:tetratricopeptide (TPR) repeat protein/tRNA A-37 threonylcarbamoyl transferase component Bud32